MPRGQTAEDEREQVLPGAPGGRWLTIHEACAFLGVDQSTLRRWSDSGQWRRVRFERRLSGAGQ